MSKMTLNKAVQAQIGANGTAVVSIGPMITGTTWEITTAAVSTTTQVLTPVCQVFVGSVSPSNLIGGTYSGQQDSFGPDVTLHSGQTLIAVWTGADVGAYATLSIFGTATIPGGGDG